MPQGQSFETVRKIVRQHGHAEPMQTCPRCRKLLIEHSYRAVVIPTLQRIAEQNGITFENAVLLLSQAHKKNNRRTARLAV